MAGQLAAHWGNADFAVPEPYESMVRAAAFHDYGWLRYETSPLLNPKNNEPYSFFELPLGTSQLESYQWSLDWLAGIDRYAGLIVSMHRTGLWKRRYDTVVRPSDYSLAERSNEVEEFIKRNEGRQELERKSWDPDKLSINYRLMQVWDLLALYFCCEEPTEDRIEPVPSSYSEKRDVTLKVKSVADGKVSFDPYPFDVRPCRIQLLCKRLPKSSFESVDEFRRAYFGGESQLLQFELI
jgi:hypothetical protein